MHVLVVGSGGREHALAWKLSQSPQVSRISIAPGNGGQVAKADNVAIAANDIAALLDFARHHAVDLTVVGPEAPLVAGIVDTFQRAGLAIFGPSAAAARLEGSKTFAKTFMLEEGIPTAPAEIFDTYEAAQAALNHYHGPVVVKASGLAAGKGVFVCDTPAEADAALRRIMVDRVFGSAGDRVLLERRLRGEEASLLAFSDGTTVVPMPPARDYKRAYDGDAGPNTGGMGGYTPSPFLSPTMVERILAQVLQPAVDGMRRRGTPFVGVLYAGLMLTTEGPQVLEFNARFGDPETQILLPLLKTDLIDIIMACIEGRLDSVPIQWDTCYNVGIVLASGGYPGPYERDKPITGLDDAAKIADVIFHAGTKREGDTVLTAGGRVLTVTAQGKTLSEARNRAYAAVRHIHFEGIHYRTDIAITEEPSPGHTNQTSAYAAAGVDIDAGEAAVNLMKDAVRQTYTPDVLTGIGAFGGSLSIQRLVADRDLVLVSTIDGVGTKTMIAEAMGVYDTIGHDIVNHCVNDILVQGARPLMFLDYIAAAHLEPRKVAEIVGGCAAACKAVGCVLIGGETAEMPGVYHVGSFDLVGTMIGWADRATLINGHAVQAGDVCLGLPSSGLHTNGYSLARRVFSDVSWDAILPELGQPLGQVLLTPHRAYLREVEMLWEAGVTIKGMAHITGGAFIENIPRVLPGGLGVRIERTAWQVPPIFRLIQERGNVAELEMYRVFNMGIGLVLIVSPAEVDRACTAVPELTVIGDIISWDGIGPRVLL